MALSGDDRASAQPARRWYAKLAIQESRRLKFLLSHQSAQAEAASPCR
jgi:hypothetical protein